MAISNWHSLQSAVLHWLGQPDDPLVAPHVPECIRLFAAEADRRLRTRWREVSAVLLPVTVMPPIAPTPELEQVVDLPDDFRSLRSLRLRGNPTVNLHYLPPDQLTAARGGYYTIEGLTLRFAEPLAETEEILVGYQQGLTPLGPSVLSNWLLREHPDAYLVGTLA